MIDVVYKLGSGSKWDNKELRYSLRSLSNFRNLGKVYIVGYLPDWVKNVIHIPATDPHLSNKDANLINKLILASHDKNISQEFLNFSDDQVLLRECSYEDFKIPYYDNSLKQFKPDEKLSRWRTRLKNTIRVLEEKGLPSNCYESHIPTLLDKDKFIYAVFQYNYPEGQGMCGNTLYFNTIGSNSRSLPSNYGVKIEQTILDIEVLRRLPDSLLHLNYADVAENEILFGYLHERFPIASIYEND